MEFDQKIAISAESMRPIDDPYFQLLGESNAFCQEVLRTLLKDEQLMVIESKTQYSIKGAHRGVILDAFCRTSRGFCNIEVQNEAVNDDIRRARFHSSIITTTKTKKRTQFKDIPNVVIVYISEYDALKSGHAVTEIRRCQNVDDKWCPIEDGELIIFANTAIKEDTIQSELLQLFLCEGEIDNKHFKEFSRQSHYYKSDEKGCERMSMTFQDYRKELIAEGEARGEVKGENRLSKLIEQLMEAERMDDVTKALKDEKARKRFYREMGIID